MKKPKRSPLQAYPQAFLACRGLLGHAWDEVHDRLPVRVRSTGEPVLGVAFACSRCGTSKDVFYDRRGYPVSAAYDYPDGYHLGASVSKASARVEHLTRSGLL